MKDPQSIGLNRTGLAMSPFDAARLFEDATVYAPAPGDPERIQMLRGEVAVQADPLGTVPPPGSLKGAAATVLQKLKGGRPEVFLDKLGERMAFERTGVRLYELLINKCRMRPDDEPSVDIAVLERIRDDELAHFRMLSETTRHIGADPTAMTPGADVSGVMATGLIQILSDTRTSVAQGLEAVLVTELTDNDAWAILIDVAGQQGLDDLITEFRLAQEAEERHLAEIRAMVTQVTTGRATAVVH